MIYLRSHLDKYLAVDSFGNVTCESEEKEPGSKFHIRWAVNTLLYILLAKYSLRRFNDSVLNNTLDRQYLVNGT